MEEQDKTIEESPQESDMEISQTEEKVEHETSDSSDGATTPQKQNQGITVKKSHLILGLALSLSLIIGGFFLGYFLDRSKEEPTPAQQNILPVDPMAPDPNAKPYDDVQAAPENQSPENISMPGYSELRMHADTNLLGSVWLNSKENSCYLRFTLRLTDTGEILYQSGLIAPGMAVLESALTRSLSRGEYSVDLLIEAFSMEKNPIPLNSIKEMSIPLYVI